MKPSKLFFLSLLLIAAAHLASAGDSDPFPIGEIIYPPPLDPSVELFMTYMSAGDQPGMQKINLGIVAQNAGTMDEIDVWSSPTVNGQWTLEDVIKDPIFTLPWGGMTWSQAIDLTRSAKFYKVTTPNSLAVDPIIPPHAEISFVGFTYGLRDHLNVKVRTEGVVDAVEIWSRSNENAAWEFDETLVNPTPVSYTQIIYPTSGPREYQVKVLNSLTKSSAGKESSSYIKAGDRRLFVQRRNPDGTLGPETAFVMKGMNWQPSYQDSDFDQIKTIARAGVETVRLTKPLRLNETSVKILDALYTNGITVIMVIYNFEDNPDKAFMIPLSIMHFKNHPAILLWEIGQHYGYLKSLDPNHAFARLASSGSVTGDDTYASPGWTGDWFPADRTDLIAVFGDSSTMVAVTMWAMSTSKPFYIADFASPKDWDALYYDLAADSIQGRVIGGAVGFNRSLLDDSSADFSDLQLRYHGGYEPPVQYQAVISVDSGATAVFKVNGQTFFSKGGMGGGGRGITVAVFDSATGTRMREIIHFDNWRFYMAGQIIDFLNAQPDGSIIALSVADEGGFVDYMNAYRRRSPALDAFFISLGSTEVQNIQYQDSWAFVIEKGSGPLAEMHQSGWTTSHVEVTVPVTSAPISGKRP